MPSFSTSRLQAIESEIMMMLDAIIASNRDALAGYESQKRVHYEDARAKLITLEADADAIDDAIVACFASGLKHSVKTIVH